MKIKTSIKNLYHKIVPFDSAKYWENRYKKHGNSGTGSYGRLSKFKAEVINDFIEKHKIKYVVDLGCGDGHMASLIKVQLYVGMDVSEFIIDHNERVFKNIDGRLFFLIENNNYYTYCPALQMTLSLDVIFHLIEDSVFEAHMEALFKLADKYVIIYSSNTEDQRLAKPAHVRSRKFTDWISKNKPQWVLIKYIKNKYSYTNPTEDTFVRIEIKERIRCVDG